MSGIHGQESSEDTTKEKALIEFYNYPFSSDEVFQQGLADIVSRESESMGGNPDIEKPELILQTQLFYFNRITRHHLRLQDVQVRRGTADPMNNRKESIFTLLSEPSRDGKTRYLTFAELKSLIEQGRTDDIPNNKVIPDTLNEDAPSQSISPVRKKPWEAARQS